MLERVQIALNRLLTEVQTERYSCKGAEAKEQTHSRDSRTVLEHINIRLGVVAHAFHLSTPPLHLHCSTAEAGRPLCVQGHPGLVVSSRQVRVTGEIVSQKKKSKQRL